MLVSQGQPHRPAREIDNTDHCCIVPIQFHRHMDGVRILAQSKRRDRLTRRGIVGKIPDIFRAKYFGRNTLTHFTLVDITIGTTPPGSLQKMGSHPFFSAGKREQDSNKQKICHAGGGERCASHQQSRLTVRWDPPARPCPLPQLIPYLVTWACSPTKKNTLLVILTSKRLGISYRHSSLVSCISGLEINQDSKLSVFLSI